MAFHLGSLGFLTPFEFDNFEEQVTNVLEGINNLKYFLYFALFNWICCQATPPSPCGVVCAASSCERMKRRASRPKRPPAFLFLTRWSSIAGRPLTSPTLTSTSTASTSLPSKETAWLCPLPLDRRPTLLRQARPWFIPAFRPLWSLPFALIRSLSGPLWSQPVSSSRYSCFILFKLGSRLTQQYPIDIGVSGESQHGLGLLRRTQPPGTCSRR